MIGLGGRKSMNGPKGTRFPLKVFVSLPSVPRAIAIDRGEVNSIAESITSLRPVASRHSRVLQERTGAF
eukprot:15398509-Heterocapsa_arctica.AAC.1